MTQDPFVIAVVPAAGSSQRMGAAVSKLLLPLKNMPLLLQTLRGLAASHYLKRFVLVVSEQEQAAFSALDYQYAGFGSRPLDIVIGGATRQESVRKALIFISESSNLPADVFVLVHDGARCFVNADIVNRSVEAALDCSAVTTAMPLTDSLKEVGQDGMVKRSLDRSVLWTVQTPQVFRYELLWQAHQQQLDDATDDASLVEALHPVQAVRGERLNFKVTTPEDYKLAQILCENWNIG